jgi:hypothetical protein
MWIIKQIDFKHWHDWWVLSKMSFTLLYSKSLWWWSVCSIFSSSGLHTMGGGGRGLSLPWFGNIPGHATRNRNDNCGYFCSANRILAQTRVSFWWMAQRIVDDYEHVDSVIFSQSDNRHITTSTWTVPSSFTASFPPHFTCFACIWSEPRTILDIVNTLKLRRQGMVKIYLH